MNLIHTVFEPRGQGPHPTILAMHGRGANALDLLGLAPQICEGRFLVICPQGPIETSYGPGMVGHAWFESPGGMKSPDISSLLSSRDQLKSFIDGCLARYPMDPDKLVALGFSQGGGMAYSLALGDPGRFAGLVSLSSRLTQPLLDELPSAASAKVPTLVQHGSYDQMIEVDQARWSVETLKNLNVPVTYNEYNMGHEITPESLLHLSNWLEEKVLSA